MAAKKASAESRIKKGAELEVMHLAETTDLSPNQARDLLQKHGNDLAKIKEIAETCKAETRWPVEVAARQGAYSTSGAAQIWSGHVYRLRAAMSQTNQVLCRNKVAPSSL